MQIHELTKRRRLNEVGAFSKGFLGRFGIDVPDEPKSTPELEALAKAPPLIARQSRQMQRDWAAQVSRAMAADGVTNTEDLSDQSMRALEVTLRKMISSLMNNMDIGTLPQQVATVGAGGQPTTFYTDQATALTNRLEDGVRQLHTFWMDKTATQELAEWQKVAQAAYDASVLVQFHPAQTAATSGGQPAPQPQQQPQQPQQQAQPGQNAMPHANIKWNQQAAQWEIDFGTGWTPLDMTDPQHQAYLQAMLAGNAP
jgi:hypothetical protein